MNLNDIKVIILCGGLGTRIKPVLSELPKCLAPIHNKPFIEYLLNQVKDNGLSQVILSTGYMGDAVRSHFDSSFDGMGIMYSHEDTPLGTGGAVRQAMTKFDSKYYLIMNGDSFVDFSMKEFCLSFDPSQMQARMALVWVENGSRYGSVTLGDDRKVSGFHEKSDQIKPSWINGGIYLMGRSVLNTMPDKKSFSLEKDVFQCGRLNALYGIGYRSRFIDIGTPESLIEAETFFSNK